MGVSKVTLNGVTLMDVTDKTVDTDNLLAGNSALRNDGESITGAVVTASPSDASPAMDGTASAGVATTYSRGDHVHPSDTNKANINNPSFTGIPTAPTASKGTDTTQIATTAFVQSAITDINYPVTSVNSKTGTVVLTASDVNALPDDTEIPTKTSDLTNDSGYITNSDIPVTSVNTKTGDVVLTAADVNAQPQINISGILKGNGTGTITAATAGTDYQAPLPSQTGNTGKFLTTNGSALSWQTVDALPSQSGNTGKFLTTNGSSASWTEVDIPTKTSELTNDSNFVSDANYVHTDNNFTGTLKTKLEGIAEGAEVNQNAFSNVKVGTSTIAADTKTDTLTLTAGSNITLTPDTTNDAVTIAATVPTKVSDLTNDSNFITAAEAPVQSVNSKTGTVTLTASDVGALPDSTDVTKWNDVSLTKTSSNHYSGYVPYMSATDSTSATLQPFSSTKTSGKIVAWDSSGYLYSSTPTARDNSGKVATTEYVDSAISGLGSILNYKGTKATESALPSTGNVTGDVWIVSADSSEYVWNGTAWEKLGPTIDLSGYVPTTRTVNGKALSTDISLDASDVGALSDSTDVTKWNGVALSSTKIASSTKYYIPAKSTGVSGSGTADWLSASQTPTAYQIPRYDSNSYLYSTTPSASDNSTKVATTAYVDSSVGAITVPVTSVNSKTGAVVLSASDVGALPDSTTYVSSVNGNSGAVTVTDEKLKTTSQNTQGNMQYVLTGTSSDTASTKNYANNLQFGQNSNNGSATLAVGSSSYKGRLRLFNNASGSFYTNLNPSAVSNNLDVDLPSSSGTLALISNIPDSTSDLTNDSGFITSSDIPVTSVNSKTGAVSLTASDLGALTNSYFGYFDSDNNIVYAPKNWNSSYLFPFIVRTISSTLRTGATVRAFDSSTNLWTISSVFYDGVAKTLPLSLSYGIYLMRYSDGTTDIYRIAKASDIPTLTSTPTANKGAKYDSSAYLYSTTPAANDNSTKVATTAYVDTAVAGAGSGTKAVTNPALTASEGTFTWNITAADAFNSPNVIISVYDTATGAIVYPDIVVNQTTGAVTITIRDTASAGSLAAGAYRAVMIG